MIELVYQNGNVFIFDIEAWEYLRKNRIIGEYCGLNQTLPALPLKLLPEEVFLLLNKNLAILVKYETKPDLQSPIDYYNHIEKNLLEAEKTILKNTKKIQVEAYTDKIIKAKREKGDLRTGEEILNEEVDKATDVINPDNMIWPILCKTPDVLRGEKTIISLSELEQSIGTDSNFCKIFQDMWDRKLYLTPGNKFGGHYLGYKGDPFIYHAMYIIHCLKPSDKLNVRELVAWGRLGSSVKKKVILSTVKEEKVKYLTLSWFNS